MGNLLLHRLPRFTLPLFLLLGLFACQKGTSQRPVRLRIAVGEIKEVTLDNPKDQTVHLTGSSDDKEIVEVTTRQLAPADAQSTTVSPDVRAVFHIQGISPGRANVVFSEQGADSTSTGRVLQTYRVEVVSD